MIIGELSVSVVTVLFEGRFLPQPCLTEKMEDAE